MLVGKRDAAAQIAKAIGSCGEVGDLPDFYFVAEAAEVLGCSFLELDAHPRKRNLMEIAFTLQNGRNKGEFDRELNPVYQQQIKDAQGKLRKARGG